MVSIWFFVAAYLLYRDGDNSGQPTDGWYTALIYLYPTLETGIKTLLAIDLFPYSYYWLNRIEHFGWSVAITLLLFPIWVRVRPKISDLTLVCLIVGNITIVGNLNEFLEFGLLINLAKTAQTSYYYVDSITDMATNLIGSMVGAYIVLKLGQTPKSL